MFRELKEIVTDNLFKITVYYNKVYINGYNEILVFEENKILLKTKDKIVKIQGNNLIITHLNENEVLIEGIVKNIDIGD